MIEPHTFWWYVIGFSAWGLLGWILYWFVKQACLSAIKQYYKDLIEELKDERL